MAVLCPSFSCVLLISMDRIKERATALYIVFCRVIEKTFLFREKPAPGIHVKVFSSDCVDTIRKRMHFEAIIAFIMGAGKGARCNEPIEDRRSCL